MDASGRRKTMSPIKLCGSPRCPERAEVRGYCRAHATERRRWNRSPNDAFYASKPWRMARRKQLFDHPLCQYILENGTECGLIADSVHHVVPIEHGGARRDPANLLSCCRPHHSAIHAAMSLDKR
jgi:5-methylcytosine-specific restriction endonuclease McrA